MRGLLTSDVMTAVRVGARVAVVDLATGALHASRSRLRYFFGRDGPLWLLRPPRRSGACDDGLPRPLPDFLPP